MPKLAGLFELADLVAGGCDLGEQTTINLEHTQQAAAFCEYLESHAQRVYACLTSSDLIAAHNLARHIQSGSLPEAFSTRNVYLKCWSGLDSPDRAGKALLVLEDAYWVRRLDLPSSSTGGRPSEVWLINPKVVRRAK